MVGERQVIERYGPGGFVITGITFTDAVLVMPGGTVTWPVERFETVTPADFAPLAGRDDIEILLIGTGRRMQFLPKQIRAALKEIGIVADAMDTGAACRTYSVLLAEERRVAAALLPLR